MSSGLCIVSAKPTPFRTKVRQLAEGRVFRLIDLSVHRRTCDSYATTYALTSLVRAGVTDCTEQERILSPCFVSLFVAVKMQAFGKSNVLLTAMPSVLYTQDVPEAGAKHPELYSTQE